MTTSLDTEFADAALAIVEEFGNTGTFVFANKTIDPTTRGTTGAGPQTHANVKCSPLLFYDHTRVNGTDILEGDAHVYVPTKDLTFQFAPKGWTATVNGKTMAVVGANPMFSGHDNACWDLHLRSA